MKKTTLMLCILLLSIVFARAQTIGLSGPTTAGTDENITLTFTGETRAKYASSIMVDYGGSTYSTYFIVINPVTSFQSSAGGTPASKFNIKVYNTDSGNQNVTIKFTYGYNGTGGAGEGSISHTLTISPSPVVTPPVVTPPTGPSNAPGPTPSERNISFGFGPGDGGFNSLNGKNFSVSSVSLLAWSVANHLNSMPRFYAEASPTINFSTITARGESISITGFNNWVFPNQGFTQDMYIRMKTVYDGNEYYSNTLFVPAIAGNPRTYIDPKEYQNELVLSPGSNISSFSATSASLARYIQDNELNSTQYKISYAYWVNTNNVNFLEVNSTNISSADFNAANIPAFTQKLFLRLKFEFNGKIFYSRYIVEVPTQ